MPAFGEGLLHFSTLPQMGEFPAMPQADPGEVLFSPLPILSLAVPENLMVQPISFPVGRAMLPSPSAGVKLGLPLHCALGETFSSNCYLRPIRGTACSLQAEQSSQSTPGRGRILKTLFVLVEWHQIMTSSWDLVQKCKGRQGGGLAPPSWTISFVQGLGLLEASHCIVA